MNKTPVEKKLDKPSPKKILALDGGGIRGILTVEILAKIEKDLRERANNEQLVLSDYFDFIAGTSTGAIIATCISLGMSMDEIRDFYVESGDDMFNRKSVGGKFISKVGIKWEWLRSLTDGVAKVAYGSAYDDKKLTKKLKAIIGEDTTLKSDKLKTLLLIVMRNATTDSPWPVSNNPRAKYNDLDTRGDSSNLHLPLWQLIRASTAAPTYFPPEEINIHGNEFIFVDGGITPYNNPSFQAFIMATLKAYRVNWKTGEDNILLVSIGTGKNTQDNKKLKKSNMHIAYNALNTVDFLMNAASYQQDMLCRIFGKCQEGDELDREIGELIDDRAEGSVENKLFTYMRYNIEFDQKHLDEIGLGHMDPEKLSKLDSVKYISDLQEVGRAIGEQKVKIEHFEGF